VQQNATPLPYPDADLREHAPRAPRVQIGGLYFLARTIDKTRAKLQGTLGLYRITPGISGYVFEGLGITEEQFDDAVRNAKSDADVVAWVHAHSDPAKFAALNEMLVNRRFPKARRDEFLDRYPILTVRPELEESTWFEIFAEDDKWIFDPANRGKEGSALS
jgi:hypothetical protein